MWRIKCLRNSIVGRPLSEVGRTRAEIRPVGVTPPRTERWSRVCHSWRIGVCPSGAYVRTRPGSR